MASRAGIDQYLYLRNLLSHNPLALRVLEAVAGAAKWNETPPPGTARGISYNCYKTYVALLKVIRKPTDADIDRAMAGNLCRCATYVRIRAAIHDAARLLEG